MGLYVMSVYVRNVSSWNVAGLIVLVSCFVAWLVFST